MKMATSPTLSPRPPRPPTPPRTPSPSQWAVIVSSPPPTTTSFDTVGVDESMTHIQLITRSVTTDVDGVDADTIAYAPAAAGYSAEMNRAETVNVLFPTFLAEDMHEIDKDNIDNGGTLSLLGTGLEFDGYEGDEEDTTTKNVGDLHVGNAVPIAFNHLTGHYTEALSETAAGGSDQTASWGGTPIVRPAVGNTANEMVRVSDAGDADARMFHMMGDYYALNGMDSMAVVDTDDQGWVSLATYNARVADEEDAGVETALTNAPAEDTPATDFDNDDVEGIRGGRLAEKDAGGDEAITEGTRGLNGGALVLPALYGGSAEQTHQVMLFLSAADDFGGAGGYSLKAAKTKYTVTVHDNMGNILSDPVDDRVFGGAGGSRDCGPRHHRRRYRGHH